MSELSSATDYGSLGRPQRADSKSHIIDQEAKASGGVCAYGVSALMLQGVGVVLETLLELLNLCRTKVAHVEALRCSTHDKVSAFELSMEDRRGDISEYQEMIDLYSTDLVQAETDIRAQEAKIIEAVRAVASAVDEEGGVLLQQRVRELILQLTAFNQKREELKANLRVLHTYLERARGKALKGKAAHEDLEAEVRMLADDLQGFSSMAGSLVKEVEAIGRQKLCMENERGVSIWPKPILHPRVGKDGLENFPYIVVKHCGFCNRGFHCLDIAVTSCKHTFHPFCLNEVIRTSNKCLVCNELFHPDWWRSWGFREEDEETNNQERGNVS